MESYQQRKLFTILHEIRRVRDQAKVDLEAGNYSDMDTSINVLEGHVQRFKAERAAQKAEEDADHERWRQFAVASEGATTREEIEAAARKAGFEVVDVPKEAEHD